MENVNSISVEVVHAAVDGVFRERVTLPAGSTLGEAIGRSGFGDRYPAVALSDANVGVFSRKVGLDHVLADDDRVEIYRPLALTPNEIRKLRADRRATRNRASGGSRRE